MRIPLAIFAILALAGGCGREDSMIDSKAQDVLNGISSDAWQRLISKRIYFGHQSVGFNIMDGVKDLGRIDPNRAIKVVETNDPAAMSAPLFAHSSNGVNKEPDTKIVAFEHLIQGGLGDHVDIAFFKFCYVDVTRETDVQKLVDAYAMLMSRLRQQFPNTQFVHMTVPLTIVESGPKGWVKQILKRPLAGEADNVRRQEFNAMLRASYGAKEPLFDLASFESTLPDGKRETFTSGGVAYPCLARAYSDGGSHLNEHGRRWVAAQMLKFLAGLG